MTSELHRVVEGGYCIGCGACVALDSGIKLTRSQNAVYQPAFEGVPSADAARVCPFADTTENEDVLARSVFADAPARSQWLGHYREILAGYVEEEPYRAAGSSGGMGTWLLAEAVRQGIVDRVIHVRARNGGAGDPIFGYEISDDPITLHEGAKSRYYPIEISQIVQRVRAEPARYAFVGIPCFLKAMRNICRLDPVMNERVVFFVGLFCGHMKTGDFATSLAWQLGIAPEDLAAVDFRRKLPEKSANRYGFAARDVHGHEIEAPMEKLFGRQWGLGFFKPQACEFCDDVVGELADVSVGDAWLPKYVNDSQGTNVVVVRTARAQEMIAAARNNQRLTLEPLSEHDAYLSQEGGFRHRREGLSYRLWLKDSRKQWRPKKRVEPRRFHIGFIRRRIYRMRGELSQASHAAFARARAEGRFDIFPKLMADLIAKYKRLERAEYYQKRVGEKLRQMFGRPI